VALLGSNPFQLDAVYGQDNVFSWSITAMILLLALHVPLLRNRPQRMKSVLVVAAVTGILMATIRQVRSEPMPMLASPLLVYLTLYRAKLWQRALPIVVCLAALFSASRIYGAGLERKFHKAQEITRNAGGIPFTGPFVQYHEFWHPVWCGLGDFDQKYGYAWDDRKAYAYALRTAEAKAGHRIALNPTFWAQVESYDGHGYYPKPFFEVLPGYHDIIREKVWGDIRRDPGWYLDILGKRLVRILEQTTPVSLAAGGSRVGLQTSWLGPLAVALFLGLLVARRWADAKLLAFSSPLSLVAFLVYSDRGMTSYSCFHVVGVALLVAFSVAGVRRVLGMR
jgi:hypothetical protein